MIPNDNEIQYNTPKTFVDKLDTAFKKELSNLNCMKIGLIYKYYPENKTAIVNVAHKITTSITDDGVQETIDYPQVFARVMFIGNPNNGINYNVEVGDEVILLFCDHEIDSWWETGKANQLASYRNHNINDCIAIVGLTSIPKTEPTNENLNIYSKNGIINLTGNTKIDGDLVINGNLTINGSLTVSSDATIGGISFLQHVHSNGNEGADTGVAK